MSAMTSARAAVCADVNVKGRTSLEEAREERTVLRGEDGAGGVGAHLAGEREEQLQVEQLVELEPLPRRREFVGGLGEVDGAQGDAGVEQAVAGDEIGRKRIGLQVGAVVADEAVDQAAEAAAAQADAVEGGAAGVEGDDAPGVEAGRVVVEAVEVGVRQAPRRAEAQRAPVDGEALADLEGALHPLDALKPRALDRPAALVLEDDVEALAPAHHHVDAFHGHEHRHRRPVLAQVAHEGGRRAVEVAARIQVEQVARGAHADALEHLGAFGPDAGHVACGGVEEGHHGRGHRPKGSAGGGDAGVAQVADAPRVMDHLAHRNPAVAYTSPSDSILARAHLDLQALRAQAAQHDARAGARHSTSEPSPGGF